MLPLALDTSRLRLYLPHLSCVPSPTPDPNLELHSAAASGNLGLVHYALTHGQPVNSLLHGCLPLHAACSGGSVSVVRMLIDRGADVNAPRLPRRYSENGKRGNSAPAVGTVGE
jgi:ankyrin repeat protein